VRSLRPPDDGALLEELLIELEDKDRARQAAISRGDASEGVGERSGKGRRQGSRGWSRT
jgi:hypothetical protein